MGGQHNNNDSNVIQHRDTPNHFHDHAAEQAKGASEKLSHDSLINRPGTIGFESPHKNLEHQNSASVERDKNGHAHALDFSKDDIFKSQNQASKLDSKKPGDNHAAPNTSPDASSVPGGASGADSGSSTDKHGKHAKHGKEHEHEHDKDKKEKHKGGGQGHEEKAEEHQALMDQVTATNNNFVSTLPSDLQMAAKDQLAAVGIKGAVGTRAQFGSLAGAENAKLATDMRVQDIRN